MSPGGDHMICRACGNQERASEGYPCQRCGTFVCVLCNMKGVTMCKSCQAKVRQPAGAAREGA